MKHSLIAAAMLAALCAPAWAINKCTGPDGKVAFQDAPCPGKGEQLTVRPASGAAAPALAAASGAGLVTNAQRMEAQVAQSQRERRRRDLEQRFIPQSRAAVEQHRAACAEQQTSLEASKYAYRQNLYGKTHAAQTASEMAAAATTCDTRGRELKDQLDKLRKECETLGCAKE